MLALPIFDTCFAILRRVSKGQSPMAPDRGHIHHRLIDMGFSQKQAVATLYVISAILGLSAVVLTTIGVVKAMFFLAALFAAGGVAAMLFLNHNDPGHGDKSGGRNSSQPHKGTQIAGNDNFFGEEDKSEK